MNSPITGPGPEPDHTDYAPVTLNHCDHVPGPFFHGTKAKLTAGALLRPGKASNYQDGRTSNNVYFSALLEPAIWGAELAVEFADTDENAVGHIYLVEPLGPFEDDPNVTNKRFPGNPTQSYRTPHALRVIEEVEHWEPHSPEVRQSMLDGLARLRDQGLDVIED